MSELKRKPPDVIELVESALTKKGFDGLYRDNECGCVIGDLAPCGEIGAHCEAGYKVEAPEGSDFDFFIYHSKEDRPCDYMMS